MATYLRKNDYTIKRQEGDDATVTFIVPDIIDCVGASIRFEIFRKFTAMPFLQKTLTMANQTAAFVLTKNDTKGFAGEHVFELEITTADGQVITLAQGNFIILNEYIK